MLQVNARKIYDEPNVLEGILANRLFLGILGAEFALQVRIDLNPPTQPLVDIMQATVRSGHSQESLPAF